MDRHVHLVAHTRGGFDRVAAWESASWLWTHLRRAFPRALAACLMPDHLHLLVGGHAAVVSMLRRVLQHHARRFGATWDIGPPTPIQTPAILRRTVRYHHLNPVRDGLVGDPLGWPWSTLRDGVGAIADPWVGPDRVRAVLDLTPNRLHHYVVSDPACDRLARRPIQAFGPGEGVVANLAALAEACAAAHRRPITDLHRRGNTMRATFVALAFRYTCPNLTQLAKVCGVSPRAMRPLQHRAQPQHLRAAALCLADPRLRIWTTPPRPRQPTAAQLPVRAA